MFYLICKVKKRGFNITMCVVVITRSLTQEL